MWWTVIVVDGNFHTFPEFVLHGDGDGEASNITQAMNNACARHPNSNARAMAVFDGLIQPVFWRQ